MTITIPSGRTLPLQAKAGGGFESAIEASASGFTGTNGETITLSGSGFEAIANPKPSAFDTFNDYSSPSDGMAIPTGGAGDFWGTSGAFNADYELDSAISLPGRMYSAKSLGGKCALENAVGRSDGPGRSTDDIYITFWLYFNESLESPPQFDPIPRPDKILRMWGARSGEGTRVSWEAPYKLHLIHKGGDSITDYDQQDFPSYEFIKNPNQQQWHRCDYWASVSAAKQAVWIDGLKYEYAFSKDTFDASDPFYTRLIGYDAAESADLTDTLRQWLAEFYEQPTIARVELSNSATYDDTIAQKRIFQKTLTRTDTEITFEAFYSDLDTSAALYAHIIKADGTVIDYGQVN